MTARRCCCFTLCRSLHVTPAPSASLVKRLQPPNCSSPCLLVCVSARACVRVRVRVPSQQMGIMEPAKGVGSPKPQLWL